MKNQERRAIRVVSSMGIAVLLGLGTLGWGMDEHQLDLGEDPSTDLQDLGEGADTELNRSGDFVRTGAAAIRRCPKGYSGPRKLDHMIK